MSRVFWDTNLFVYYVEDQGALADRVQELRERMLHRGDHLVTSSLTLGELLVKPRREQRQDLISAYETLLTQSAEMVPFDNAVARRYATIRAERSLKAPDAIQLACAAHANVELFITNDDRLSKLVVPGIHFITSLDRAII